MFTTSTRVKYFAVVAAVAASLGVVGCSNSGDSSTSGSQASAEQSANFNAADVTFLQQMYPHHAQAVEMAKLADGRTENRQVLDLAAKIEDAQAPEMEQMTQLLESFGESAPTTAMNGGMGHDMGDGMETGMGMMSQEQMDGLEAASGADFDRMFLQMMIEHHNGAIEMAETELTDGRNDDVKKMAQTIIDAQKAEVEQMTKMLDEM